MAVILMVAGVGLFGTFTAFVASFFVGAEQKKEETEIQALTAEVRLLRQKIESMEQKSSEMSESASAAHAKQCVHINYTKPTVASDFSPR